VGGEHGLAANTDAIVAALDLEAAPRKAGTTVLGVGSEVHAASVTDAQSGAADAALGAVGARPHAPSAADREPSGADAAPRDAGAAGEADVAAGSTMARVRSQIDARQTAVHGPLRAGAAALDAGDTLGADPVAAAAIGGVVPRVAARARAGRALGTLAPTAVADLRGATRIEAAAAVRTVRPSINADPHALDLTRCTPAPSTRTGHVTGPAPKERDDASEDHAPTLP
jgi:hypothetical protein